MRPPSLEAVMHPCGQFNCASAEEDGSRLVIDYLGVQLNLH
jgi:hypothetical protein